MSRSPTPPSFEEARTVVDQSNEDSPGTESVTIDTDVEGRYVRVTATELYEFDSTEPPNEGFPQLKTNLVREERRTL